MRVLLRRPPLQSGTVLQMGDLQMDTTRDTRWNETAVSLTSAPVNMPFWNI